ncbi:aminoglycoside phosphotransferase [Labilithrix luteola]|uniref:Aminoglycoside phosphotransferase n=1 Tax=Labilithrix luteola TaxID=1391654 RepID=A0A0K1Q5I0_9BACT|nr:aminoglycoside phosphotransferase family protein [Labilithrix luteola]AKV00912.1 aminoglycoside phosphotransferase [Labilithrix luteola]
MTPPTRSRADLLALLPEDRVGVVDQLEPINIGLSGAGVWAVHASRGEYILRIQSPELNESAFLQHLRVQRRAAEAGVAPEVVHVDEGARAVVSQRVSGMPMGAALGNPTQRERLFASIVDRLRTLHSLDATGIEASSPLAYARKAWEAARGRPGFPGWAASLAPTFDAIGKTLDADPRSVVSHNDVNPTNVMWDGTQTWLIDWDVAALGHPYYDLATLALFLRLEDGAALDLAALHDGAPLDEKSRASFRALRTLVGLLTGFTFLGLVDDLNVRPAKERSDAPTLTDVYAAMRARELDPQTAFGQASMGLALLAESIPA